MTWAGIDIIPFTDSSREVLVNINAVVMQGRTLELVLNIGPTALGAIGYAPEYCNML